MNREPGLPVRKRRRVLREGIDPSHGPSSLSSENLKRGPKTQNFGIRRIQHGVVSGRPPRAGNVWLLAAFLSRTERHTSTHASDVDEARQGLGSSLNAPLLVRHGRILPPPTHADSDPLCYRGCVSK
jgi:hypothetical protein